MKYEVEIINLCPHDVVVIYDDGTNEVFPKCEAPARIYNDVIPVFNIGKVPILRRDKNKGNSINIPEPKEGVFYIVSEIVQRNYDDRTDLLCPGPTIKTEYNTILGCIGLMIK